MACAAAGFVLRSMCSGRAQRSTSPLRYILISSLGASITLCVNLVARRPVHTRQIVAVLIALLGNAVFFSSSEALESWMTAETQHGGARAHPFPLSDQRDGAWRFRGLANTSSGISVTDEHTAYGDLMALVTALGSAVLYNSASAARYSLATRPLVLCVCALSVRDVCAWEPPTSPACLALARPPRPLDGVDAHPRAPFRVPM